MKTYQLFIFISLLLLGRTIGAASPTFGPEFNFTNDELIGAGRAAGAGVIRVSANEKMAQRFYEKVIEKCPECTYSQRREPRTFFSIRHPDDWSFEIALDPWVVEVHTDPMTTDQLRARQLEIQRLIFDTALELDLFSQDTSGHIHVGLLSAFDDDPKLFRNFIVDWTTYSRMASVLFGADSQGAPTMDMRGRHRLNNFRKIIAFFDQKLLNPEDERAFWVKVTKDIFLKKLSRFLD
ncbi:MAG: hypothetical protein KDD35_04475, partial [Bdellovibrionales bacterium]|nr:hypothetical protein [Bdellovibrionales bacterium]